MLSDLRAKLEPVGRLDVLDAVGEKVIAYYDERDPRQMSSDDLGRRARAFHLLGEIDSDEGDLESAYRHFNTAYEATSRILAVDPSSPARIYEHAQSAFWAGGVFCLAPQRSGYGRGPFHRVSRPVAPAAGRRAGKSGMAGRGRLCPLESRTVYIGHERLRDAQREFRQALELFQSIADESPDSESALIDLADAWGWMAYVAEPLDGRDAAMEALREQIRIYDEQLGGGADNWTIRRDTMTAEYALARLHIAEGRGASRADIEAALQILIPASHEPMRSLRTTRQTCNGGWSSFASGCGCPMRNCWPATSTPPARPISMHRPT